LGSDSREGSIFSFMQYIPSTVDRQRVLVTINACYWINSSDKRKYRDFGRPEFWSSHSCYLSSFSSFCQAVSEEKIFYESTNQQHELPVLAMFVNRSKMSNLYRGPSIDATYHISVHLAKRFRSRRFLGNLPISNTNCLCWWLCLCLNDASHSFVSWSMKISYLAFFRYIG
jgi:hypothetical protein